MVTDEGLAMDEVSVRSGMKRDVLFRANGTVLKIATLPTQVCDTVDMLQQSFPGVEVESISQSQGLHWAALRGSTEKIVEAIHRLRSGMLHPESSVSVLQMADGVVVEAFEIPPAVLNVMRAIKEQFDPENILSPGKFF
jgi:glycolate oxidase FAD binding subunit